MKYETRKMSMLSLFSMLGAPLRMFGGARKTKSKAKLYSVVAITPGRQHAWCDSDCGRIRKPLSSIPMSMLNTFKKEAAWHR